MSSADSSAGTSAERPRFVALPGDERLSSAMLSDSLDEAGLRDQVLARRLAPLVPGSRVFGRAWTAEFEPVEPGAEEESPDDPYGAAIDYISAIRAGEIAVIATGESNASAFWGELFSAAAIGAGALGVITDGNLRDTAKIAGDPGRDFPVNPGLPPPIPGEVKLPRFCAVAV